MENTEKSMRDMIYHMKHFNKCKWNSRREEENVAEAIFEEIITKIFPKVIKSCESQNQKLLRTL